MTKSTDSKRLNAQGSVDSSAAAPFTPSDLPIDDEGRIYHLQVKPEQIAPDIILVGDPGRAEFIGSNFLRDIEFEHEHRGLVTVTGTSELSGKQATMITPIRTTAATSGIGTPSLEIVINEIVALHEIDFQTRRRKLECPRLNVIRVGTSGGLQATTQLGTLIITSYAVGLDNSGLYYEAPYPDETCQRLENEVGKLVNQAMIPNSRFAGRLHPYIARAHPILVEAMVKAAEEIGASAKLGLTASAPGFFAAQGRDISRLSPSLPDVDQLLADYDPQLNGQRFENMEMEASFLLHFLGGLGHWAGVICPSIAHRRKETFDTKYEESVEYGITVALQALADVRSQQARA